MCFLDGDLLIQVIGTLERLAKLGNGDQYGNSDGNVIALEMLNKIRGRL